MLNLQRNEVEAELELTKESVPMVVEQQRTQIIEKVRNSPEVQTIIQQIDVMKPNSIMTFGGRSAEEISKSSDSILRSLEATKTEDAGQLILVLNKIMDKFDPKDFEKEGKQGFLQKIFSNAKNQLEELFKKYHTMGDEVEKVFVSLRQFESEIQGTNRNLDDMYQNNIAYYEQLQRYIVAGEMAVEELTNSLIPQWEKRAKQTGDRVDVMTVQNLHQAKEMMEQRIYDLRLAENVSLQTLPMIKAIQYSNYNLVRKINSAFIVTLPVFKQALAQSIMLKRQAVQAKAITALDEKTNELLTRNAENTVAQTKATAKLASGSFVQIETLEKTWQTIMKGIEETKQIQSDAKRQREEGSQKLLEFKRAYEEQKLLN
ncbi:toxic anion resistance protein (plasmid) [Aneurinibacillus sp. Ricciae_BoGa-3]|uniref:toxic anion resistance protein n=1 Tax=Aneurinibacillus sp. Ricciae_BoGa-3 TaxID=3022697 RepID=UPI00234043B3|nr:toxic anion resistance protein [Aneurinibacillus sp. Ricciae_BoGa-3]WCK57275.1 toxic anion resistance protein [Aneurinibacillus sp. Ricciae_BoGa-3]